jgi:uncharacterized SAM-binding protein YcdF (DUF218 family)
MFFILSKSLLFLISPLFWWCILLLLAFYSSPSLRRKRFRFIAITWFLFFSNTFIFLEFERLWEIPSQKINTIQRKYDVGIVLGGMANYNNDLNRLTIHEGTDRIWHTITLYKKGIIQKILISGKNGFIDDNKLNEAQQFKKDLTIWGIPETDIILEDQSKNTYENALFTKKILQNQDSIKSILLITSSEHMRRAQACFKKQNISFDTFTTNNYNGKNRYWSFDHLLIPSFDTFIRWNSLTKEWIGYITYKLTGKI